MIVLQHLLFVFLLVVAPAWDFRLTQRLKRDPGTKAKLRYYKTLCLWLWMGALLACFAVGHRFILTTDAGGEALRWLLAHAWVLYGYLAALALLIMMVLLPILIAFAKKLGNRPRKYSAAKGLERLSYFLPQTWPERHWFAILCITAGICEEILFRGFLIHYLHSSPLHLSLPAALVAASVVFGLQHLYQGIHGVISSTVIGTILGVLFLITGGLLSCIALHALLDLRMLSVLPPPEASHPSTS